MCTVTLIARKNGYALGMNRDEKLSRVQGLPPSKHLLNGRAAIFPSEPSGGTWIGVNDAGVTFALINWYSVPMRASRNTVSRGQLTRSILAFDDLADAEGHLASFPLKKTNPFRLIGVFPQHATVLEWRWNLSFLERVIHDWKTNIWISSGFDEPVSQKTRFQAFLDAGAGKRNTQEWLRALHASHAPSCGPHSICMHRDDALTVSYTELTVTDSEAQIAYSPSSLCRLHNRSSLPFRHILRVSRSSKQMQESTTICS